MVLPIFLIGDGMLECEREAIEIPDMMASFTSLRSRSHYLLGIVRRGAAMEIMEGAI